MRIASRFNYTVPDEVQYGLDRHLVFGRWSRENGMPAKNLPLWRGKEAIKFPADLLLYHQIIYQNRPDWIVETGTGQGGTSLFLGDTCDILGNGQIITIDIYHRDNHPHSRVRYLDGNSVDPAIVAAVSEMICEGSVMVIFDSDHSEDHVRKELMAYAPLVSPRQYLVVEDAYDTRPGKAYWAVASFLRDHPEWERVPVERQFLVCATRLGWLRRRIPAHDETLKSI